MKYKLLIMLSILVTVLSCKKDTMIDSNNKKNESYSSATTIQTENDKENFDKNIIKIAKSLAISLNNKDLRKLLKEKASLKEDGDYDILWKDLKVTKLKIGTENLTVREFIGKNIEDGNKKDEEKLLDQDNFSNKFKRLQFSVPVNCEKWNPDSYKPLVAFITSDYKEDQELINAYDSEGRIVKLNNRAIPEFPVIVVSMNERSDENGKILKKYAKLKNAPADEDDPSATPPAPNLSASVFTTGILLSWANDNNLTNEIYIEKNSGSGFQQISVVSVSELSFIDSQNLTYGNTYFYRLKTVNAFGNYSSYSNTVSIVYTGAPSPIQNFSIINTMPNEICMTWNNSISYSYGTTIKIARYNYGVSSGWEPIATLSPTENSYIDAGLQNSTYPYNRYWYKIYYASPSGNSEQVFDVSYNSNRLPNQRVVASHIKVADLNQIESWVYGAPEFDITIYSMDDVNQTPTLYDPKKRYEPTYRIPAGQSSSNNVVYNDNVEFLGSWNRDFVKSVLSIHMVEYDGEWISGNMELNVGVKKAIKSKTFGDISISLAGNVKADFKNSDKDLGTQYIYYWDDQDVTLNFGYGVKTRICKTSSTGDWQDSW